MSSTLRFCERNCPDRRLAVERLVLDTADFLLVPAEDCVDDGMEVNEQAFRFFLSDEELLHMKKVVAFIEKNGVPLTGIMSTQEIFL